MTSSSSDQAVFAIRSCVDIIAHARTIKARAADADADGDVHGNDDSREASKELSPASASVVRDSCSALCDDLARLGVLCSSTSRSSNPDSEVLASMFAQIEAAFVNTVALLAQNMPGASEARLKAVSKLVSAAAGPVEDALKAAESGESDLVKKVAVARDRVAALGKEVPHDDKAAVGRALAAVLKEVADAGREVKEMAQQEPADATVDDGALDDEDGVFDDALDEEGVALAREASAALGASFACLKAAYKAVLKSTTDNVTGSRVATLDACLSRAEEVRLACEDAVFALCPPADRDALDDALHRCRTSAAASAAAGADVCDDVEVSGAARDAASALSL